MTRQVLLTSLFTAIVGIGFGIPALAQQAHSPDRSVPLYNHNVSYTGAYSSPSGGFPVGSSRRAGYPCTWSGSRDLVRGEAAYRSGRYGDAITQWKTAASKDCAIAAYKLGMLYYGGKSQVAADRSLGAAWLQVAADSETASGPYYQQMSHLAVRTLTKSQRAEYAADYARVRTNLGLPTVQ